MPGRMKLTPQEAKTGPYREQGYPLIDSEIAVTTENCADVIGELLAYSTNRVRENLMGFKGTPKEATWISMAFDIARKQGLIDRDRKEGERGKRAEQGRATDPARGGLSPAFGEALAGLSGGGGDAADESGEAEPGAEG